MIDGDRCRSDCDRPVTQRLVMRSQSGRAWTVGSCDDEDHVAGKYALAAQVGFEPERLESVSA